MQMQHVQYPFKHHPLTDLPLLLSTTQLQQADFPQRMSYYWSFGDGTFSTAKNPVKTYATSGWKAIQLTINDSAGCIKNKK
jgi:PKD repeat protein